jgi:RNA polymerase sigma-70 factor (ECF subfamily)
VKKDRREEELITELGGTQKEVERAFTEIYARYAQRTYAYILRMTNDEASSQDLLQEVFIKFYHAAQQGLVFTNPSGFILVIAKNLCLNWKRDARPLENIDDILIASQDTSATIEQNELLHLINLSLEILEFDYRQAFVLKYYQGCTYDEMALITGETIPALKNKVWRAKEQIKQVLKPYILENQQ